MGIDEDDVSSLNQPNTKFIPNEIFALEKFDVKDYDIGFHNITIEFADIKTETSCFNLTTKAEYNVRFNIVHDYDSVIYGEEVVDIKYVDCNSREEYQLTDEMKKIAIPYVIDTLHDDLYDSISEKQWELRNYDYSPPND